VHEIKFDGYRAQVLIDTTGVRIVTRNGLDWTGGLGGIAAAFEPLGVSSAIIDGEAIVRDARGVSDFGALQRALKRGAAEHITLMAFDLLYHDGEDLRPLPLLARKQRLEGLLQQARPDGPLQFSAHMSGEGPAILREACGMGLEGIVSKRVDRPYRSGRSGDWLKAKCVTSDDLVILGYAQSNATRRMVGSLVLGYFENGTLVYAGRVGTGFSMKEAAALWEGLENIRRTAPGLARRLAPDQRAGVHWVLPLLVAEIEHRGWTADRIVRHAVFKRLRDDKAATDIGCPASLA
jgi:bifunctional non-homologous end joining protein LigD